MSRPVEVVAPPDHIGPIIAKLTAVRINFTVDFGEPGSTWGRISVERKHDATLGRILSQVAPGYYNP